MKNKMFYLLIVLSSFLTSCSKETKEPIQEENVEAGTAIGSIEAVKTSGSDGNYSFSVTISSPDEGCNQYADWWEVVSEDGTLLYRRILTHSHVNEQPFTRSGGPVNIPDSEKVIVRMHMNNTGYSINAMNGSVSEGWEKTILSSDFATGLSKEAPLPSGCAF
ncbi:MAG: hypothetical protein JXR03_09565 [Cyclobacteriaceae bacterium]